MPTLLTWCIRHLPSHSYQRGLHVEAESDRAQQSLAPGSTAARLQVLDTTMAIRSAWLALAASPREGAQACAAEAEQWHQALLGDASRMLNPALPPHDAAAEG